MKLHLVPAQFSTTETLLLETSDFSIHAFTYSTGVEALRIQIGRGQFVWLPFFGQSLWSWKLDGVEQKFEGFVQEPDYAARDFLHNYGAFMIHCGITAMGNPTKEDTHLHHGELPLARYKEAWIEISDGPYPISLCGKMQHRIPFIAAYEFAPSLRILGDGTSVYVDSTVKNLQKTDLRYMYLNHLNFAMTHAVRLEYAMDQFTQDTVTVLDEVVPGVVADPSLFLKVGNYPAYSPELVAIMKNQPQFGPVSVNKMYRSDGTVVWVAANTKELDHTVAWLTKTPDRGACGFSLPATAGPRGLAEEGRQKNVKTLEAGNSVTFKYVFGLDKQAENKKLQQAIELLGGQYE